MKGWGALGVHYGGIHEWYMTFTLLLASRKENVSGSYPAVLAKAFQWDIAL